MDEPGQTNDSSRALCEEQKRCSSETRQTDAAISQGESVPTSNHVTFVSQKANSTALSKSILASIPACPTRGGSSGRRPYCGYLCLLHSLAPGHCAPNPPRNQHHRTRRESRRSFNSRMTESAKLI